ncbi:trypsin-like peptidase domain-containing protein [Bremerella sp. T1]|uniref:trypsin-like peptidase domain-containing protein n=1 Tax=Bremerella sp. TYQ1 TaxID=3119568 RepID=UPI001CCB0050|nr:trypsin-like peptidase domain-containing protein [Bremerella volcania]UBM38559.1 PDZ domain-containing protein [Bremerella volcania]
MPRFRLNTLLSLALVAPLSIAFLAPTPAIGQVFESDGIAMRFMKRVHQRSSSEVLGAFNSVVRNTRRATVELKRGGKRIAMGGVVDPSGLIVTKASLVNTYGDEFPLVAELANGDQYLTSEIAAIDKENDLALVRIDAKNLPVMEIAHSSKPAVGSLLASSGLEEEPISIGVYGLTPRPVEMKNAMLGVMLSRNPGPATVDMVVEKSAAANAGILAEDIIVSLNDMAIDSGTHLIETVRTFEPGDSLRVKLKRAEEEMQLSVILGEWVAGPNQARHEFQNHLGGELSTRRSGFPSVFQHDSYLQPEQCGGPIVNLDGQVVGLNIARAGRVATYAIPGNELAQSVSKMLSAVGATGKQQIVQSRVSAKPVISENGESELAPGKTRWIPSETSN